METDQHGPHDAARDATRLRRFRTGFYRSLTGWADAAFELCDAALCAPAPVASVPVLSLEPIFRRSHGSLYKALEDGHVDAGAMRDLLADHRPPDVVRFGLSPLSTGYAELWDGVEALRALLAG